MAGKVKAIEDDDDLPGSPEPKASAKKKPSPAPVEEDEPEEKPAPPKKHSHNSRLVDLAVHFGYSQAEMDSTPSDTLRQEIQLLQATVAANRPAPAPEKKVVETVDEEEEYLASLEANPEVDPKHAKFLRQLKLKADKSDQKELREKLTAMEERDKQRDIRQHVERIDNAFTSLGKKYEPIIGTGSMYDLTDPGERGWRAEIAKEAKIGPDDSQKSINTKIAAAAAKLAAKKVKVDDEDEPENPYEEEPIKKKTPAKDPESGRFTAEDFERGVISKPSGKKGEAENLSAVEQTRQHLRKNGDPRGFRPVVEMEDDDVPA